MAGYGILGTLLSFFPISDSIPENYLPPECLSPKCDTVRTVDTLSGKTIYTISDLDGEEPIVKEFIDMGGNDTLDIYSIKRILDDTQSKSTVIVLNRNKNVIDYLKVFYGDDGKLYGEWLQNLEKQTEGKPGTDIEFEFEPNYVPLNENFGDIVKAFDSHDADSSKAVDPAPQ